MAGRKFFDPHFHVANTEGPHSNGVWSTQLNPYYSIFDYEKMMSAVNLIGGVVVEVISDKKREEARFFDEETGKS